MFQTHRGGDAAIVETRGPAAEDPGDGDEEANADDDEGDVVEERLLRVDVARRQEPRQEDSVAVGQQKCPQ